MHKVLDAGPGSKYRLTQVKPTEEKLIRARVFDGSLFPMAEVPVALHYNTEPPLLELNSGRLKKAWQERAFFEYTDKNGVVEFPFDLHQGGPYTVWVLSHVHPSDGVTDITSGSELFFRAVSEQEVTQDKEPDGPTRLRSALGTVLSILEDRELAQGTGIEQAIGLVRSAMECAKDL